jgi:hypothetical protein
MARTLNESIDVFFRQFAKEFIRNRARDIVKRDLRNTEGLLRSLYAKVTTEPEAAVFFMRVYAKTYGRYQDMSRTYTKAGGDEMIQSLEQWVGKEGIAKFKKGRYGEQFQDKTPQQIQNAVAWGIVQKLKQIPRTRKRGWWNAGKTRDIENFYDVLVKLMQESIAREMKENTL